MRQVNLTKSGAYKINSNEFELYPQDIEINFTPMRGEFVLCTNSKSKKSYIAILENIPDKPACIVLQIKTNDFNVENYIEESITRAYFDKKQFYNDCFRVVHGASDNLPGIIIDSYANCILVQINLSAFDQFRGYIKSILTKLSDKKVFIIDDEVKRHNNDLPIFEKDILPNLIQVLENEIIYQVESSVIQKNGYYYDHRENRLKARRCLENLNDNKSYKAIDLFSYVGSWGLNLLKSSKINSIDFIDQGDFESAISKNMQLNNFNSDFKFVRTDVFKHIDFLVSNNLKYDVICCDPPAFSKSIKKKSNAIEGYRKLVSKLLKVVENNGLIFFGSCTKYVTMDDLMEVFRLETSKTNIRIKLIDIGTQSYDHTNIGMQDKSNYIKFFAYRVEY